MGDVVSKILSTLITVVIAVAGSAGIWVGANLLFNQVRDHWSRFSAISYGVVGFIVGAIISGNQLIEGTGGGDGSFGGDSVFSEVTLPQNGTGASSQRPTESKQARGETGATDTGDQTAAQDEVFESVEARLLGKGGETKVMDNDLQHIVTRITDEGLVIELFALEDTPLFIEGTDAPTPLLRDLSRLIAEAARTVENAVAVEGHVPAQPIVVAERETWKRSMARADAMRVLLEQSGVATARIERVTGHADREPAVKNPMAVRNNRIEVIFLRE